MTEKIGARRLGAIALTFGLAAGPLTACGSQTSADAPPSVGATSAAPTSAPPTPSAAATSSSESPSVDAESEATPTDEPTGPSDPSSEGSEKPPVLDQEATGRDLTLSDFFAVPDSWRDGRFDVAGKRGLAGISGNLSECSDDQDDHSTLELRLANRFKKISMKIGQSDDSESSDAVLNVRLVGNGKYIDSVKVPFNKIDDFSVPVGDVNALKVEVWIGGDDCEYGKPVGAVLSGLQLE